MDQSLPTATELVDLLGRGTWPGIAAQVEECLVAPARELLARRSKSLRGQLVAAACDLLGGVQTPERRAAVTKVAAAMELLHAGSLIIDDIQDGSVQRRGGPSLHLVYGVPSALCTGNWLYFGHCVYFQILAWTPGTNSAYSNAITALWNEPTTAKLWI